MATLSNSFQSNLFGANHDDLSRPHCKYGLVRETLQKWPNTRLKRFIRKHWVTSCAFWRSGGLQTKGKGLNLGLLIRLQYPDLFLLSFEIFNLSYAMQGKYAQGTALFPAQASSRIQDCGPFLLCITKLHTHINVDCMSMYVLNMRNSTCE